MSAPNPDRDDQFSALLADFDEALASGQPVDLSADSTLPAELRQRLHHARSCLQKFELFRRTHAVAAGAAPAATANGALLGIPSRIGRFEIVRELGRGGFGIVFLAHDPLLDRAVALKVPRLETLLTPELRQRFMREAQAAASLDHPNIVPAYEAGAEGALCYIVSAYCEGPTLAAWLKARTEPVPCQAAAALVADLALAVQHAHDRGILHRDLKPANILLKDEGGRLKDEKHASDSSFILHPSAFPKITDFGLAKLREETDQITGSGILPGTPAYMAPEQAVGRGETIGPATDVHALGVILYEVLTSRLPFAGETALATLDRVHHSEPIRPRQIRADVPRDLEVICLKCLRKQPGQRYASARSLAEDLGRFLGNEPIQARPVGLPTHIGSWCRRPERMRDAGVINIVIGSIHLVACLVALLLMGLGLWRPGRPGDMLGHLIFAIVVGPVPLIYLGWRAIAQRGWAIYVAIAVYLSSSILFTVGFSDRAPFSAGGLYDGRNPETELALAVYISVMALTGFLGYIPALIAYRYHRRVPTQAHPPLTLTLDRAQAADVLPRPQSPPEASGDRRMRSRSVSAPLLPEDRSAGPLRRIIAWCRRPERIHAAGTYMMFVGIALTAFCLLGLSAMALGAMPVERPREVLVLVPGLIVFIYLPMICIGWKTVQENALALWAGTVLLFGFGAWNVMNLLGFFRSLDMGGIDDRSAAMQLFGFLVAALFATLFASYLLALVAHYSNKEIAH